MSALDVSKFLDELIEKYTVDGDFSVVTIQIAEQERGLFARLRYNPKRFTPEIFDREWAGSGKIEIGELRVLRIIVDNRGVGRALGRQGHHIYVYPV